MNGQPHAGGEFHEDCQDEELTRVLAEAPSFPGFELIAALSHGTDLDVFDVWSSRRRTRCILKCVRKDRTDDPLVVERLHREGDLLLRLTHPHIVRAYAVGTAPLPHLIEETLTGFTLAELLRRRGRLGLQELLHLADHLSAALCYLHDEGILHLDLKPANIVAEAGRVKLIDFSLAHPPGDGPAGWGTHSYLSPEQALGGSFATATDIWGLGMVLHEAATGREVFSPTGDEGDEGDDEDGTYPQLVMPVPSLRLQRRLPASLRGIIEGCLRPAAEERPDLVQIRAVLDKLLGRTCAFGE